MADEPIPQDPNSVLYWDAEIERYERQFRKWHTTAAKIVDRYSLKGGLAEHGIGQSEFNILWSNVQTMAPALFSRPPVPSVTRRFKDRDALSRIAAQFLQRALEAAIEGDSLRTVYTQVVQDVLLTGRGTSWVRYDADFDAPETPVTYDAEGMAMDADELLPPTNERAPIEYVHWRDFYHAPLRTWDDVRRQGWVARRVFMSREEGMKRFGEAFRYAPLTAKHDEGEGTRTEADETEANLVTLFEIWDVKTKRVYFYVRGMAELLHAIDDPLQLDGFLPCPMPVYGSVDNNRLVPIPDYLQYSALADELDDLTSRISVLSNALRVRGVYDSSMQGLQNLLADDGLENVMIGVPNMSSYFAAGSTGNSVQGVVQFLPIRDISETLINLYQAREQTKQVLFEVSGLSDVIRGTVNPDEKATATRIKSQFGAARLDKRRMGVDDHVRDGMRIKAEIMVSIFQPDYLRQLGGFDLVPDIQSIEEPGMRERAWRLTMEMLRDDRRREFTIDIETNSTIIVDTNEMLQKRVQMLTAVGGFMREAFPILLNAPQVAPAMVQLLLFTVRSFTEGRELEAVLEEVGDDLVRDGQQQMQGGEQPSPEQMEAQQRMQSAEAKGQLEIELKKLDLQAKQVDLEAKTAMKGLDLQAKSEEIAMSAAQRQMEIAQRRAELQAKGEESMLNLAGAEAKAVADITASRNKIISDAANASQS